MAKEPFFHGMADVPRPRGVTYRGTFHQWFSSGASAMRVLPTICVHICRVSQVFSHSANGSAGQSDGFKRDLVDITPAPILARLDRPDDGVPGGMKMFGRVLV